MKIRSGFVSNSSSSSFVLQNCTLDSDTLDHLAQVCREEGWYMSISYRGKFKDINFNTHMDNFNMEGYVRDILDSRNKTNTVANTRRWG